MFANRLGLGVVLQQDWDVHKKVIPISLGLGAVLYQEKDGHVIDLFIS